MKNRATKHRKIELTTEQIKMIRQALNYVLGNDSEPEINLQVVASIFNNLVEDVVVTIVD